MRASWRNVLHQIHMSDVTTNTTTTTAAVKSTRWHEHILLIIKSRKTGHVVLCSQSLCFYLHLKCSKQWLSLTVPVHYINALSSYYLQEVFFFFFSHHVVLLFPFQFCYFGGVAKRGPNALCKKSDEENYNTFDFQWKVHLICVSHEITGTYFICKRGVGKLRISVWRYFIGPCVGKQYGLWNVKKKSVNKSAYLSMMVFIPDY